MADKSRQELIEWLQLAGMPWMGATIKAGLIKKFKKPAKIFSATRQELFQVKGWSHDRLERFAREGSKQKPVCSLEVLEQKNVRMVCFDDPEYPELLRRIPDSPIVLFVKGNLYLENKPALAVVGARNATQLGYDIAKEFAFELAKAGFVIVSGLALGIDTYAHRGAVEAEEKTIAVLGCGCDILYPKGNRHIREKILDLSGALVSEYPPGTIARPWHFPVRNRIISGMCVATLVVEATARSGSLITARLAAEQDREVFAIPGNIRSSLSEGTLALIQEGANLVTEPGEIIDYFSALLPEAEAKNDIADVIDDEDLTSEEKKLLTDLSVQPLSIDSLLENHSWKRERLFSLLLTLEMRDYLIKLPGNCYQAKIKPSKKVAYEQD
jgi:DNA processing protein